MLFASEEEIILFLNKTANKVLPVVQGKILNKLKDNIFKYTYSWDYFPNKVYADGSGNPTFEFQNSWEWKEVSSTMYSIVSNLFQNWMSMTFKTANRENPGGIHAYGGKEDIREKLASLLNIDGKFGHKERQPFWDITIEELDKDIYNLFEKEFKKYGVIRF